MNAKHFFSAGIAFLLGSMAFVQADGTFRLATRNEAIPENGVVTYTVLRTDENEFNFLPPHQWRQTADQKSATLSWTAPDFRTSIQMQVREANTNEAPKLNATTLRDELVSRNKQVKIVEEFPCYTSGGSGLAFDWERPGESGFTIRSRSAFIPIAGGQVELTLTTSKEQFDKRQMDLMRLLNSLRITPEKSRPASSAATR